MRIGTLHLQTPVILAPMAGITDLPYRRLMKSFGAGLVFTEMVSAEGLVRDGKRTRELLRSLPEERPLGVQLFGHDPDTLAAAVRLVEEDGDLVDLNLGCPVNKVVRSGAGSALLRHPKRVGAAVEAMRRATSRPLTVKIRSGWDSGTVNFLEIARIAAEEGADAVTLHPRTRAQGFSGLSDWEQIRMLKETLAIPVIGSGDIVVAEDAVRMREETGCDGFMIGRGAYGNPWLVRDALVKLKGGDTVPPTASEKHEIACRHLRLFLETFPERKAVRDMRKHLAWYSRGLPGAASFRTEINLTPTLDQMRECIEVFFAQAQAAAA